MKKKLSLTNLAQDELKKSEMKKTLAGHMCSAMCSCSCINGGFVDAINATIGRNLAEMAHTAFPLP